MRPPFIPIHIGDYRRDTGHLRAVGHGGYLLLIMHYWATGGLPTDEEQLATIACMSAPEWKKWGPVLAQFFGPGWTHPRIDNDLAKAEESHLRRVAAGSKGGTAKQCSSNATAGLKLPITHNLSKKDTVANATADADATPDLRKKLFNDGLRLLAEMTGRTPDSCRSLVGRWLKLTADEALHVLAAIEDAHRNRVADPTAWITATLRARNDNGNKAGQAGNGQFRKGGQRTSPILAALEQHGERISRAAASEPEVCPNPPRLLQNR